MTDPSFWARWVWPAGGSGGIPGDVVGTLVWVIIAAVVTYLAWPPMREALKRYAQHHADEIKAHLEKEHAALHEKLDHIIKHSPTIPPLDEAASKKHSG